MTTNTAPAPPAPRVLRSGAFALIDERGVASILRCDWLVQVLNGNPEPDFPEDCYDVVPCGATVRVHPDYPEAHPGDALLCDAGHDRLACHIEFEPYGPAWEREATERLAEGGLF